MKQAFVAMVLLLSALSCAASKPLQQHVDRILIEKQARRLTLFSNGEALRSYTVALGGNPVGHKRQAGDERTPEGLYAISGRNANSSFYRSLQISYPNARDKARAEAEGVDPGGLIMIHGIRNGLGWVGPLHRFFDWTDGCVAVTNSEMEEICASVKVGTPVEIRP